MKLKIYQVDAFTDRVFAGNPAAVCPLEKWLSDEEMQNIAMENNLAETAFYVPHGKDFQIRWFTPSVEVALCGHATLAAAYVLFHLENYSAASISFHSRQSGILTVTQSGDRLTLNFPADEIHPVELNSTLSATFQIQPKLAFKGKTDYMLVFADETDIRDLRPNLETIAQLDARGVIATAKGDIADFVCRFFAPQSGINEDPVTGSAYTSLAPYWAERLGKNSLSAVQLSARKGYLNCNLRGERVEISGKAKLYMTGEIYIMQDQ